MVLSAAGQIPFPLAVASAAAAADTPSIPVVVLTGLSLVFGILILLYVILLVEGKIFTQIDRRKKEKLEQEKQEKLRQEQTNAPAPAGEQVAAIAAVAQSLADAAPGAQAGIPPEVVAAIAAAVAEESQGQYVLESVSVAPGQQKAPDRRGRWGFAGVIADTEPF